MIPAQFSSRNLSGKAVCKAALLQTMGLPQRRGRVPLMGIISRLADQKGFDLIGEAIERIAEQDLQMVVLGTGQLKYHELFQGISARYPDKIAVKLAFDNRLAHQIEAGADMFLMPSKYEPCGLNQLYSLRYGTVPIVRATGGLADTITDYDIQAGQRHRIRLQGVFLRRHDDGDRARPGRFLGLRALAAAYGEGYVAALVLGGIGAQVHGAV